jgi:arsenate reductase (thioredoxin)
MKFSFPSNKQKNVQQRQQQDRVILFVCVENAGRSQIAEGFFNQKYAPKGYRAMLEPDLFLKLTLSQFKQ